MLKIRTATISDIESLVALAKVMHAERLNYGEADDAKSRRLFTLSISEKAPAGDACLFVAEVAGQTVGFLMAAVSQMFFNEEKCTTDLGTYVSQAYRNSDALEQLIAAFEAWAVSHGVRSDWYFAVGTSEDEVQAFERLGYRRSIWNMAKKVEVVRG
jgi:GNAT superfamily N-acetyltransferase